MQWQPLSSLLPSLPMPEGYSLEELKKEDVSSLTQSLQDWYPDIIVGAESCHLDPQFYETQVYFREENSDKPIFAGIVISPDQEKVGLITLEKNNESLTITSRMGALSPKHRGQGLAHFGPALVEVMGRAMGAELAHYFVTLKIPHQQIAAEKAGYQLVGIVPAIDRDMVSPRSVKRVFEAIYAKVLVEEEKIFYPPQKSLTPKVKALWDFLFPDHPLAS